MAGAAVRQSSLGTGTMTATTGNNQPPSVDDDLSDWARKADWSISIKPAYFNANADPTISPGVTRLPALKLYAAWKTEDADL
jgi:hypothetical protein